MKFQTFVITVVSEKDGVLIELAEIGEKRMLIATDKTFKIADNKYHQEAYGLFPKETDALQRVMILRTLEWKIEQRRSQIKSEAEGCKHAEAEPAPPAPTSPSE